MKIIWKRNDNGGESAYLGSIRVASYFYNGIDSRNGSYKGSSLLPQSKLTFKTDSVDEIKNLVDTDVREFLTKLGVDLTLF
jgi:hypothetical protein